MEDDDRGRGAAGGGGGTDTFGDFVGEGAEGGVDAGWVFYRSLFKKIITNHFLSHLNAGRRRTGRPVDVLAVVGGRTGHRGAARCCLGQGGQRQEG